MRIYAAVIEWPNYLADRWPALILSSSEAERDAGIAAEISETADVLTDPEWRDAIAHTYSDDWHEWLDVLGETSYGEPFVTLYTREFPA